MTTPTAGPAAEKDFERIDSYPPPYPEGWYVAARERDVGTSPLKVRVAGNDVVLFRGAEGRVHAVDTYCPHMGADLSCGRVVEGLLECPFHQWRFAGDGQVAQLRKGERLRPGLRVASWAVDALHGWVLIYHRHGEISRSEPPKPPYQVQPVPEIETGELRFRGEHDEGIIRMHLLEFSENSVDVPHFETIHGPLRIPWTNIRVPGFGIHHDPTWETSEAEPHVAWFKDVAQLKFRDKLIPGSGATALIRIDGPGGVVRFDFDLNGNGRIVMFQSHTPVAPLEQHVRFRWWSERRVPKLLASYVVGNWVTQWRQDVPIWEKKIYQPRPLLMESDGPVMKLRRWYGQFYPEGAPSAD
jgi:nitrite reductase/ring-hydroxylating ferredoxin subunit